MTGTDWQDEDDISVFALGTTLLRSRWRIIRWMLIGGVLAGLSVISKKQEYQASASFILQQGNEPGRAGLASLAGQFGVAIPGQNASNSPDFYSKLVKSRVLLQRIVDDTLTVAELGGKRISFLDLFGIMGPTKVSRDETAVRLLSGITSTSVDKTTGIIGVSLATAWPSVSLAIVRSLVEGVNDFNERTRQGQAGAERKFVEGRMIIAASDLRQAEDRLEEFLKTNKQIGNSAELAFERERLQRTVTLRQQVYTALTQSFEDARIREVRDTPAITLIEPPFVPPVPLPRRRIIRVLTGLIGGGFVGALLVFVSASLRKHRGGDNPEADEFVGTLRDVTSDVVRPVRWVRNLVKR